MQRKDMWISGLLVALVTVLAVICWQSVKEEEKAQNEQTLETDDGNEEGEDAADHPSGTGDAVVRIDE